MSDLAPQGPTRAQFKPLKEVRTIGEALKHPDMVARFREAVPKHVSPERMLRVCALAVAKTPKLAECDMMSLLGAMLALAALGMEPNTPLGHAYLIPFEKRKKDGGKWVTEKVEVQVIIGYRGYIDLARRSGSLVSLHADVVYEGDIFSFEYGSNMHLKHIPQGARGERKALWAYFHAKLTDGEAFEVLPYAQVLKIRDGSQGYISAQRSKERYPEAFAKNPWVAFEHEMVSKTLVRRMGKWIPMSIELANAAALDAMSETGNADLRSLATAGAHDLADTMALAYDEYVPPFDINAQEADPVPTTDEPQEQRRQAEPQRTEANPSDPKPSTPAPDASVQTWSLYLLTEDGELVDGGHYTDPVLYIRALRSLYAKTPPKFRDAMLEANDEFMGPAATHPMAAQMVDALRKEHAAAESASGAGQNRTEPRSTGAVDIPKRGQNQNDLVGYIKALTASLAVQVFDDGSLSAWRDRNSPIYSGMPKATRGAIDQAIATRRGELGLDRVPTQDAAPVASATAAAPEPQPQAGPTRTTDDAWADDALATIDGANTVAMLTGWSNLTTTVTVMKRLAHERDDLYAKVRGTLEAKVAKLKETQPPA